MKNVCVITGGGSGMGLAAAKNMPKDKIIIIAGRTEAKLEKGVKELTKLGFEAYAKRCDTSKRKSVRALAEYAKSVGEVKNVINCAGLSPSMADPEKIVRVNALGTVYVNQEFAEVMKKGSVIIDVSSNSAYILPGFLINKRTYSLADSNEELFVKKILKLGLLLSDKYKSAGLAYSYSKNFTVWYAGKSAFEFGAKGIRVASISPGLVATDMGNLEETKDGGSLIKYTAEKRMGMPEELGYAIATLADERNGYLTGVDVLCDGGSVKGRKEFKIKRKCLFSAIPLHALLS